MSAFKIPPARKEMPFGWEHDGVCPRPVPEEQFVLTFIKKMKAFGESYREIAAALNKDGLTNRGAPFRAGDIVHLLEVADEYLWKRYHRRRSQQETDEDREPIELIAQRRKGRTGEDE